MVIVYPESFKRFIVPRSGGIVAFDVGAGGSIANKDHVHQKPRCAAISIDERMNADKPLMQLGCQDDRV